MTGMIPIVLSVVGLLAILSWIVALMAAVQIVSLAPAGTRMRNYYRLGWWKFAQIRADAGPAVDPAIRTYKRAFIDCFVCVILVAVVMIALGAPPQT
jgi:hypothetical protein